MAAALRAWHEGGAAAGDLAFWRGNVAHFRSPKAYALVIETLLDRRDPVAAMALLVQWLSQADEIPLVEEDYSFHDLALLWMEDLWDDEPVKWQPPRACGRASARLPPGADETPAITPPRWSLARKFLDYLEANADEYWQVPHFDMAAQALGNAAAREEADEEFARLATRTKRRTRRTTAVCSAPLTRMSPTATAPTTASRGRFSRAARTPPISSWSARPSGSSAG